MQDLVNDLVCGRNVVFITGAGLSVSSGIPPYRGQSNAVWSQFVTEWGNRRKFKRAPLTWWNKFWLRTHEKPDYMNAKPNDGHKAIGRILERCARAKVITQNIDTLHCQSIADSNRLIEIHGHLGLYKCISPSCANHSQSLTRSEVAFNSFAEDSQDGPIKQLKEAPVCPQCGECVLPQALLFDEDYESHPFYQWDKAMSWLEEAHTIVFVGTSFSVGITAEAVEMAASGNKAVYNFNLQVETGGGIASSLPRRLGDWLATSHQVCHILGQCEQTLALMAWTCDRVANVAKAIREMTGEAPVMGVSDLDGSVFTHFSNTSMDEDASSGDDGRRASGYSIGVGALGSDEMEVGAMLAVLGTPHRKMASGADAFPLGGSPAEPEADGGGRRTRGRRSGRTSSRAGRTTQPPSIHEIAGSAAAPAGQRRGGGGGGEGETGGDNGAASGLSALLQAEDSVENGGGASASASGSAAVRAGSSESKLIVTLSKLPNEYVAPLRARLSGLRTSSRRAASKRARPGAAEAGAGEAGSDGRRVSQRRRLRGDGKDVEPSPGVAATKRRGATGREDVSPSAGAAMTLTNFGHMVMNADGAPATQS